MSGRGEGDSSSDKMDKSGKPVSGEKSSKREDSFKSKRYIRFNAYNTQKHIIPDYYFFTDH